LKKYLPKIRYFLIFFLFIGILTGITYFEKKDPGSSIHTVWDALWFSIVTLTTVGYGDSYPITPVGKIFGLLFILSSLGLLGYLIGSATNLIRNYMENKKNGFFGSSFREHFVIIGWNNFGKNVAEQILLAGNRIAIVTNNKSDIDQIYTIFPKDKVFVLFTDLTHYADYSKVNLDKARSVFINLNNDSETLVFVINMKKHYSDIDYIISLQNVELKETFQAVGVKHVLGKNEIASKLVASYVFEPDVADFTEDLIATSGNDDDYDIQQYKVLSENPYAGKNYLDSFISLKRDYNSILIGLSKFGLDGKRVLLKNPGEHTIIEENDYMLIISDGLAKKNLEKIFQVSEGYYV
jgi:voltage-gated potassium channel